MSVGFAGSKGMDDRRRRRLATENDESTPKKRTSEKSGASNKNTAKSQQQPAQKKERRHFPLRKIISHRKWKIGSFVLFTIVCTSLMILSGYYSEWVSSKLGEGISTFANPLTGKIAIAATGCLFLFSAQLGMLIWWVRSHSESDFEGQFRIWSFAAFAMLVASFAVLTDAHSAWSSTLRVLFHLSFWKQGVICWLAPSIAVGFSMLLGLHKDMRDCRMSHSLLWLAAFCGSAAAFLSLKLKLPYDIPQPELLQLSLMLGSAASLFSSMLLHTRYVIHESAEAPRKRTSLFVIIGKKLLSVKIRSNKTTKKKTTASKKQTAKKTTPQKKAEPKTTPKKETVLQKRISKPKAEPAQEPEPVIEESPAQKEQETVPFERVDPHSLKGLSKKERRKLRKQAREEQRSGKRAA